MTAKALLTPQCRLCGVPFTGVRGWLFHAFWGVEPFRKNPNLCNR